MFVATMTSKGQTTIPSEIRESLHLKPSDKLVFIPDGDRVYIKTFSVNIDGLAGSFRNGIVKAVNFSKLREAVKVKVTGSLARRLRA